MNVPIVQGVAVPQGQKYQEQPVYHQSGYVKPEDQESGYVGGGGQQQQQQQPKQFKDAIWAVLFLVHLVAMSIFISSSVAAKNMQGGGDGGGVGGYGGLVFLVSTGGVVGVGLSSVALGFMLKHAVALIKMSLFFNLGFLLCFAAWGFLTGDMFSLCFGLIGAAFLACYAYVVWHRIPFAAANLNTAITAVKDNMGLTVVAYGVMALAFVWTFVFFLGVDDILNNSTSPYVLFVLLLSYYWVHQVLQNTIHVTVAGTIGTWWFIPSEATSGGGRRCWSQAVTDSLARATTYSFGSICLGSLILAIVQALRTTQRITRDNDDCSIVNIIIDCILGCIEGLIEYLNKWAYIYVGLYGFDYIEAGKNVFQLFQNKGWTVIITDDLAETCLWMVSMLIGLLTGLVTLLCVIADPTLLGGGYNDGGEADEYAPDITFMGFIVGFLAGYVFSTILMSIVASAVNTVIVCFAESPGEFQQNHPQLSDAMRAAWIPQYPELRIP